MSAPTEFKYDFFPGKLEDRVTKLIESIKSLDGQRVQPETSVLALALNWKKMMYLCCELTKLEREYYFFDKENEIPFFLDISHDDDKEKVLYFEEDKVFFPYKPVTAPNGNKSIWTRLLDLAKTEKKSEKDKQVTILQRFPYALSPDLKDNLIKFINDIALQIYTNYAKFESEQTEEKVTVGTGVRSTDNVFADRVECQSLIKEMMKLTPENNTVEEVVFKFSDATSFGDKLSSYLSAKLDYQKDISWDPSCDYRSLVDFNKFVSTKDISELQTKDVALTSKTPLKLPIILNIVKQFLSSKQVQPTESPIVTMSTGGYGLLSSSRLEIKPIDVKAVIIGIPEEGSNNPLILIMFEKGGKKEFYSVFHKKRIVIDGLEQRISHYLGTQSDVDAAVTFCVDKIDGDCEKDPKFQTDKDVDDNQLWDFLLQCVFHFDERPKSKDPNKSIYKSREINVVWLQIKKTTYTSKNIFGQIASKVGLDKKQTKIAYTLEKFITRPPAKVSYAIFKGFRGKEIKPIMPSTDEPPKIEDRFMFVDDKFVLLDVHDDITEEASRYCTRLNEITPTTQSAGQSRSSLKKKRIVKRMKTSLKRMTSFSKK